MKLKISTPKTDSELSELKNYHHFAGEGSKVRESSENSYGMLPQLNDRSSKKYSVGRITITTKFSRSSIFQ